MENHSLGVLPYMNGVTFARGRFVAVGERGGLITSPDGVRWSVLPVEPDARLKAITTGPMGFVAVGARGSVVRSKDGASWSGTRVMPAKVASSAVSQP